MHLLPEGHGTSEVVEEIYQGEDKKMRVLLVNPFQIHLVNKKGKIYNRLWPPLDLANCAAFLRKEGYNVQILDANVYKMMPSKVADLAKGFDKIFISSSSLDRWQCPTIDITPFINTFNALKKITDQLFIIGPHGTVRPVEMLKLTEAKCIIRGEPEMTILDICKDIPFSDIYGITFRKNEEIVSTKDREPFDLNSLPLPAFDLLPMEKYRYELLGKNLAMFEGSRGCHAKCIFCLKAMYGKRMRKKSPEKLIEEVEYAIKKFNVRTAYFMDLEFTVFPDLVNKLCDYLIRKRYDFTWTCQTRFDKVDKDLLQKMKKAGCKLIHFGVETASERIMEMLGKGITLEEIRRGIKLVHSVGIQTACFFMFGFPTESERDIQKTIDFAKELNPTYASFHIATPYPGTEFYNKVKYTLNKEELFTECYTAEIDYNTLKNLSRKAYIQYYLRPSYILLRAFQGDFKALKGQLRLFLNFLSN